VTTPDENQPTLDGLELGDPDRNGVMRNAVVKTIQALNAEGLIEPRHTAMAQLALELGEALSRAKSSGKPYAIALVAGQLRDTLEALPAPLGADDKARFNALVDALLKDTADEPASP
jgi:uncharacterized protein YoaH (UPF0181 family)